MKMRYWLFFFFLAILQYKKMSKWGLLAAMQAIAIYIILKLEEGENEYNQIDSLLVASIFVSHLFFKLVCSNIDETRLSRHDSTKFIPRSLI